MNGFAPAVLSLCELNEIQRGVGGGDRSQLACLVQWLAAGALRLQQIKFSC